jgi:hypothetical protein
MSLARHVDRGASSWWILRLVARRRRGDVGGKKKDLVNKNHGWNPSNKSTRQMRTQVDTTQRKNKSKQSTKIRRRPYAKRTHEHKMTINNTKKNLRMKVLSSITNRLVTKMH